MFFLFIKTFESSSFIDPLLFFLHMLNFLIFAKYIARDTLTILIVDYNIIGLFSKTPTISTIILINTTALLISSKNISESVFRIFKASSSSKPCFSFWFWLFPLFEFTKSNFFELTFLIVFSDFTYFYFRHILFITSKRTL